MGLLVTLFLISSNVYNSVNAPEKRGFSYIETWMIGAQGVILFALLEYGLVLGWKKYSKEGSNSAGATIKSKNRIDKNTWIVNEKTTDEKIAKLDLIALFISTFLFLCFNIYYWHYS